MILFQTNDPDSLYINIIKKNFAVATELMAQGQEIPKILYAQVTGHDDVSVFSFLIEAEPFNIQYLTELAVCQGAINCIKLLIDKQIALSSSLLSIFPRKNADLTLRYLREALRQQSSTANSEVIIQNEETKTHTVNF